MAKSMLNTVIQIAREVDRQQKRQERERLRIQRESERRNMAIQRQREQEFKAQQREIKRLSKEEQKRKKEELAKNIIYEQNVFEKRISARRNIRLNMINKMEK